MKLTVDEIKERVSNTEDDRKGYVALADQWERMWSMNVWPQTWQQALKEGREQVTLPTAYNTVNLAMRLFANEPKIEVPPCHPSEEKDDESNLRERWLKAMWTTVDYQTRRSTIADLVWQSLVRGRHALEVKWIRDELPEKMRDKKFPILIRTLDPLNVGVSEGPLWTNYAFHKYRQKISQVIQRYPNIKRRDSIKDKLRQDKATEIDVIDFWWAGEEGEIWNAVLVDDDFTKKPVETDYPMIPIIEGFGDSAPISGETFKGMSVLHPMRDLFFYNCRLVSQMATGVQYYFWPMLIATNEEGREIEDFEIKPGQILRPPPGTKIDQIAPAPNVPLAQAVIGMVDGNIQQSSFPGVLYGQAPGELQAGYGVSLLSDAAKGRVNQVRFNLERTLEYTNQLVLAIVEEFGEDDGVTVWGKNERAGNFYSVTLTKDDIEGYYENRVTITPAIPADIVQRQTLAIRMMEAGIISKRTVRDKFLDISLPEDEAVRVAIEQALQSEELTPKVILDALREYFPDDWEIKIAGTSLEQVAMAEQQALNPPPPQPPMPPPGMFGNGPQAMPPGMPPMPPGMGPGGPMPPGMPPGMMGPPPGPGGPMGPGGPPPPIQPPSMNLDMGTLGVEQQGQLTPELMGLPPGMDPAMFAQLMGQPLPPGEELNGLLGGMI